MSHLANLFGNDPNGSDDDDEMDPEIAARLRAAEEGGFTESNAQNNSDDNDETRAREEQLRVLAAQREAASEKLAAAKAAAASSAVLNDDASSKKDVSLVQLPSSHTTQQVASFATLLEEAKRSEAEHEMNAERDQVESHPQQSSSRKVLSERKSKDDVSRLERLNKFTKRLREADGESWMAH
eukprot:PhM_4_TR13047/c0_g1_i1/m.48971